MKKDKQNLNNSNLMNTNYYDFTSPINNLTKSKQRTLFKNSIHNNLSGKIEIYKNKQILNTSHNQSFSQLKAGSVLYKVPQFLPQNINHQISDNIKQKVSQLKHQYISFLPQISGRSSNYNPKRLQNIFNHRSSILQLQTWLKQKLINPPISLQQCLQYKNMIMGIGMKDLIRIINKRCIDQGKLVEEIWELTWNICREIIVYLAQRAKKCEDVLEEEIININTGFKDNMKMLKDELLQSRQKLEEYSITEREIKHQINKIVKENQKLKKENGIKTAQNNSSNQQFLNILEENLALYLHVGDHNKKDWIKRMYRKVQKAKGEIQKKFKENINKTYEKRLKDEKVYQDNDEEINYDEQGNMIIDQKKKKQQNQQDNQDKQIKTSINHIQGQNKQSQQYLNNQNNIQSKPSEKDQQDQSNLENEDEDEVDELAQIKNNIQEEFARMQKQIQTDDLVRIQIQIQSDTIEKEEKQTQTQKIYIQQLGINTQAPEQVQTEEVKKQKQKLGKNKGKNETSNKKNNVKISNGAGKSLGKGNTVTKNLSGQKSNNQNDQSNTNKAVIEYICKQCQGRKNTQTLQSQYYDNSENNDQKTNNFGVRRSISRKPTNLSNSNGNNLNRQISQNDNFSPFKSFEDDQNNQDQIIDNKLKQGGEFQSVQNDLELYNRRDKQNFAQIQAIKNKRGRKRESSLLHDINFKKQVEKLTNFNNAADPQNQGQADGQVVTRLTLQKKQPYYKFFIDQIKGANQHYISQIVSQPIMADTSLNNYFSLVQQINSIPQNKIFMSEKQILTTIEKNLMPIVLQLLGTVKKAITKKNLQQTMRSFHSLPFVIMNKFSTKYGVKILAMKNMRLLLCALKKIQIITDRYKSLKLMLFTDCRAVYSQDLFVYLLIFAMITPFFDTQRSISFEEVTQMRQVCEKFLTSEKKVYEEFEIMTKNQYSLNKGKQQQQNKGEGLKISPLIRSIITNYRMVKLNRIQQVGFVFLMLNKDNILELEVFSYFMSCLKIKLQDKMKIMKVFLANCDIKTKSKKVAISESSFGRFLIRCPQFSFQMLNEIVSKQKAQIQMGQKISTKKAIQNNNNVSKGSSKKEIVSMKKLKTNLSIKFDINNYSQDKDFGEDKIKQGTQKFNAYDVIQVDREILRASREDILKGIPSNDEQNDYYDIQFNRYPKTIDNFDEIKNGFISNKLRDYSYFTYRIAMFLENHDLSKFMNTAQRLFLKNYIYVHIMHCEMEEIIGMIDYFSNQMLEIICVEQQDLKLKKEDDVIGPIGPTSQIK